ncbi:MAG: hypothetical protein GXY33_14385 [Phycisphaerae bacterium]|nr:hypothetical protein [Phycisphaerae bacterium]
MMKDVVLVTSVQYAKGRPVWDQADDLDVREAPAVEADLARAVCRTGCRAVILGVDRYTGPLYEAVAGGLIARFGVGYDGVDQRLCREHNVTLTNTPGVLTRSVAEHAMWLMGAVTRNVACEDRRMREGRWSSSAGVELFGKTLLAAGFGQIGRAVARIAGAGFGMNVIGFGRRPLDQLSQEENLSPAEFLGRHHLQSYTSDIDAALPEADAVSVHMASTPETHRFFDASRFARFREGAFFINTARGAVVDEAALYQALRSGRLAGAGLDVFEKEPYAPADPQADLRTLDNVVMTPHTGSNTRESNRRMAQTALQNCRDFLSGRSEQLNRVW